MASTHDAVQFYWDPVCPWCWITSRWMEDVGRQKAIDVDWRFFSLRKINEGRDLQSAFGSRTSWGFVPCVLLRRA
jgi:predicted DsbA family dithiol-disulfide isomerase